MTHNKGPTQRYDAETKTWSRTISRLIIHQIGEGQVEVTDMHLDGRTIRQWVKTDTTKTPWIIASTLGESLGVSVVHYQDHGEWVTRIVHTRTTLLEDHRETTDAQLHKTINRHEAALRKAFKDG